MTDNNNSNVERIMDKYNKELENFFEGNGKKSFDKITSEALDKIKKEVKQVAENKQKEVDSKKTDNLPICGGKVLKPNKYDAKAILV
jgi:vesicle coat complex subunit